ncbi:MAG TPA: PhnD/SsuA/transferrin family substrate-binding protein [Kofleriaceae bacterium]|nr:PhnD/SsuA/transferrin family substrate-binding protein [Kofleriaceae bacterium]
MRRSIQLALVAVLAVGAIAVAAAPGKLLLVICSPGSPGSTEEAQPRIDAFARALSAKAGTTITAVYEPTEAGGVKQLGGAAVGVVSLPFFLVHEKDLGMHARLVAVQEGRPALESWVLVAQKGRIHKAEELAGFTIASSAAFAPGFVRAATAGLGALPANVKLQEMTAVLSSLRRAAAGEPIAVLLDGPQAGALKSLAFADKLDVVTRSPAWPAGIVVSLDARMPAKAWAPIQTALTGLAADRAAAQTLAAIQIAKFVALDEKSLASARQAYGRKP